MKDSKICSALFMVILFVSISSCDIENELKFIDNPNSCDVVTEVDTYAYEVVHYLNSEQCWLADNLKLDCEGETSWLPNQTICEECADEVSRLYTWDAANCACDSLGDGWRLPTDADWLKLEEEEFGFTTAELIKYDDETRGVIGDLGHKHLGRMEPFNTEITGWYFEEPEGGCNLDNSVPFSNGCLQHYGCYTNEDGSTCQHHITYYWTATEAADDNDKAVSRKITSGKGINRRPISKSSGLYVRCVKY